MTLTFSLSLVTDQLVQTYGVRFLKACQLITGRRCFPAEGPVAGKFTKTRPAVKVHKIRQQVRPVLGEEQFFLHFQDRATDRLPALARQPAAYPDSLKTPGES